MSEFLRRIRYILNRRRHDEELDQDMEFHLEMAARDGGVVDFGDPLRLREQSRDAWGWTWIDRLGQDLRYAIRQMRGAPGFTLAAVFTLAIGIGINVAAFGFFNLVMLKPLPVRDPDTLLRFHRISPRNYASDVPYPAMRFYREHTRSLSAVLALDVAAVTMEGEDKPLHAHFVTANYFEELGGTARFGRLLVEAVDGAPGTDAVAVLGHEFWLRHFGGDPAVAGKTMRLNGRTVIVAGVVSSGFSGFTFRTPDVWLPLHQQPLFVRGSQLLENLSADNDGVDMWGRLRPGVSAKAAGDELRLLTAEWRKLHPNHVWEQERLLCEPGGYAQNAGGRERGTSPSAGLRARLRPVLVMVGALAFLILAVACGNLGSLLLARGVARQREIMIRRSVGAGSGRLIRQLMTESVALALLGAGAGLALGFVVLRTLLIWTGAPAWLDTTPDWRVAGFTAGVGLMAAVLFGLAPALQVVRQRHRAAWTRKFLVTVQVAASCVLLIVAGLLVRALNRAVSGDPGFEYRQVIAIDPRLGMHGYSPGAARSYLEVLRGRLEALPGVESVSIATNPPLGNRRTTVHVDKEGDSFDIHLNRVDPGFLRTMRIPLLRGRDLRAGDRNAVVVSASLARRHWPGQDPLGQELPLGPDLRLIVAGVAGDARALALADPDAVEAYLPVEERDLVSVALLVRAERSVEESTPAVVSIARAADPAITPSVESLKSSHARRIESTGRSALAVAVLGSVALMLSCLGIVGVVAYGVSQRSKEIGIRMALGAKRAHVLAAILGQLATPVAVGLLGGVGGAAALSQVLRRELHGVSNLDPLVYAGAVALFAVTAALSALAPARRALRIDPLRALRHD
jgi:predicted permease